MATVLCVLLYLEPELVLSVALQCYAALRGSLLLCINCPLWHLSVIAVKLF